MLADFIVWIWWIYAVTDRQLLCSTETTPGAVPTRAQLMDACKFDPMPGIMSGKYSMEHFEVTRTETTPKAPFCVPPAVPNGSGMLETPPSAEGLWTDDTLLMLAERLRWYARTETPTEWQNKFNQDIYSAALSSAVPAHLLKALIGVESQFWPLWLPSEFEIGMGQITDAGADAVLRYDEGLFNAVCKSAVIGCEKGYHILTVAKQQLVRDALRASLVCHGCTVDKAIAHEQYNIGIYARVLRAYGCRNGWDWYAALKDYNGGDKYLDRFGLGNN